MGSPDLDLSTLTPEELARAKVEEELQKLIDDRTRANAKAEDEITDSAQARKIAAAEAADKRANAVLDRETTKVAQAKAVLDNETVRLDNEKKAKEGTKADYDSLAAKIASAVPKFSEIPLNTLSVPDGLVLRESENVSIVLDNAAKALVDELKGSPVLTNAIASGFVITEDSKLARSAIAYYVLKAQIEALTGQATTVEEEATTLLDENGRSPAPPNGRGFDEGGSAKDAAGAGDIITGVVAAAATAVTEVAALFQTESELSSIVSEPDKFTVFAKLSRRLIGEFPGTTIRLDEVTPVAKGTGLLSTFQELIDAHGLLVDASVRLGTRIDELEGDENAAARAPFVQMKARVDAVKARLEKLIEQITTEPAAGGYAPLAEAIIRSSSAIADPDVYVLIVPPPKAYSDQVVVKRRLAAPRLSVSTFIELPYILLKGGRIVWAGTPSSRTGFIARFV